MNVYDSSTEIADAGDISNHVKLLEVHCTFAHAMGQFEKKIGNSSFIAGQKTLASHGSQRQGQPG